jgi:hypothetical protein
MNKKLITFMSLIINKQQNKYTKRVPVNEVNYLCVVLGIEFSLFALFMCILGIIANKSD